MKLYVTYSFQNKPVASPYGIGENRSNGSGRILIDNRGAPQTFEDICEIEAYVRSTNPNFDTVFLTFWSELKG